jgi:hypothetical protein
MSEDDDKKIKPQDLQKGGRFSKGQSGNPKGRPKKAKPEVDDRFILGELPSDKLWRAALARPVTAKTPDGPKTMSFSEALVSQYQNAAIKGNRIAMERVFEMQRHFELADAKMAEDVSEFLRGKKEEGQAILDAARQKGSAPPVVLPYPSDIILDRKTRRYELHGPYDTEDLEVEKCQDAIRLWLLLQSAQFYRRDVPKEQQKPCPWMTLAWVVDAEMPPSYRWTVEKATSLTRSYQVMNKKQAMAESARLVREAQPSEELLERIRSSGELPVRDPVAEILDGVAAELQRREKRRRA